MAQDVTLNLPSEEPRRARVPASGPLLMFTTDPTGRIDFVTDRWADVIGGDTEALLDFGFVRLLHPDDRTAALASWRRHVESGLPYAAEWRVRRSDGTYRYIEIYAEPRRDAGGAIVGWYGAAGDVDVRRRAMDALDVLAESGARLAAVDDIELMLSKIAHSVLAGVAEISIFDLYATGENPVIRQIVAMADIDPASLAAIEGHRSPLEPGHPLERKLRAGQSYIAPNIDDAFVAANVRDVARATAWRTIGVRSLVVAPLRVAGRTIGALSLLRTRFGAPFDEQDRFVIEEIARRVAVTIDNLRLGEAARRELRRRDERFHDIADSMPHLMWTADATGRVEWANKRWMEYTGQSLEDILDPALRRSAYEPNDFPDLLKRWEDAVATGTPLEVETRLRRHDGVYQWFLYRAVLVPDTDGTPRWYGSAVDIDATRRMSRAMRAFADIGIGVGESLGLAQTLSNVMHPIVPEFADWGFITLRDEAGDLRLEAVYHTDRTLRTALQSQVGQRYARGDVPRGTPAALRRNSSLLLEHAVYDDAATVVEPGILRVFWTNVGFRSVISVPLVVGSEPRGALTLCMSRESTRNFTHLDVPFFEELARRIAPAIGNAEAYEREHRVAQSFQRAALPALLPERTGFSFDAMYAAGRTDALIGGDWYDAFVLADGRIVLSIGDVAGSGLQAAVIMSNVRQTIRGVAQVHADPSLMLASADAALREESPDRFVTAFVGVIDPVSGAIEYASAGHPPPLVRYADGRVETLEGGGGAPLGLRDEMSANDGAVISPGAVLVLYTDGLIEATRDIIVGEAELRDAVATFATFGRGSARAIYDAVLHDGARDDVAILIVAREADLTTRSWTFDARDPATTNTARAEIVAALSDDGYASDDLPIAELILAELVANLIRYAPGPAECILERHAGRSVLHMLDEGPGFTYAARLPNDIFSENGRGLYMVTTLSRDFSVTRRRPGGSHARVVLRA